MELNTCINPYLYACLSVGLACILLPVMLSANGELNCSRVQPAADGSCCFSLGYDYNFPQNINNLETRLLTSGVFFSGVQYGLASGWQYETLQQQRRLRWTFQNGAEIPVGEQSLFDFCLSGWNPPDSIELLVLWRVDNVIAKRDTLRLGCTNCWEAAQVEVECQPDSSYLVALDFLNQSGFRVDFLDIREPAGQDFIVEETITPTTPIVIGGTLENIALTIRPAADGLTEVCFELTPRQQLTEDISLDCCTATYCIQLPECDRCCTPFADFTAAVDAGFSVTVNCEEASIQLQANALNDCDRVTFVIEDLGGGIVDGNESITLQGLIEDRWYEVCMTANRQDRSGVNCFEMAELTVCDSFLYDCDHCLLEEQIDLSFDCPPEIELVCACDSMTYLNACAAQNWAGVTSWEEGRRCDDPQLEEIPLFATLIVLANETQLSWSVSGLINYRYFFVQRMLPDGEWITIDIVDNTTFMYTDVFPANGLNKYRVVGVVQNGKVVFSNEDQVVDTEDIVANQVPIKCWPNPVREQLHLQFAQASEVQITLWDFRGQLLARYTNDTNRQHISINFHHPPGSYLLTVHLADGTEWYQKIIKP